MDSNILNQDLKDCINALQHGQNVYMTRGKGLYDRRELIRTLIRGLSNINILVIASNAEDVQRIKTGNGGIEYINSQGLSDIELSNVDFVTYRELVVSKDLTRLNKKYRLIIFNECHRIGGGDTKVKVEELLKNNIGVPRIGITTLEEGRADNIDIEKLYFTGTRLSDYGLKQAIYNKNITEFNYVVGTTDDALKAYIRNNCKEDVDEVTKNIFNVINSKEILLKHINNVFGCIPNTMKIIGFCASDSQENLGAVTLLNMLKSAFPEHELLKYNRFNKNETGSKQIQYVINPNLEKDLRFTPDIVIILNKTTSSRLIARYISTALRFNSTSTALIFDFLNNIQSKTDKRNAGTGNDHADSVKKNLIDYGVQVNNIVVHDEMKNAMDFIDKNRMDRKKAFMEQMMALREKKLAKQDPAKARELAITQKKNRISESEIRRLTYQAIDQEKRLGLSDGSHLTLEERLERIKKENIRRNTEAKKIRIEAANRRREEAEVFAATAEKIREERRLKAENNKKLATRDIEQEEKELGLPDRSNLPIEYRRKLIHEERLRIELSEEERELGLPDGRGYTIEKRRSIVDDARLRMNLSEEERELGLPDGTTYTIEERKNIINAEKKRIKEEENKRERLELSLIEKELGLPDGEKYTIKERKDIIEAERERLKKEQEEQRRLEEECRNSEEIHSNPIYPETYNKIIDEWNENHNNYATTYVKETDDAQREILYTVRIGSSVYKLNKWYTRMLCTSTGYIGYATDYVSIGGEQIKSVEENMHKLIYNKDLDNNIFYVVKEFRKLLEFFEIYKSIIYLICQACLVGKNEHCSINTDVSMIASGEYIYRRNYKTVIEMRERFNVSGGEIIKYTEAALIHVIAICDAIKMILKAILDKTDNDNIITILSRSEYGEEYLSDFDKTRFVYYENTDYIGDYIQKKCEKQRCFIFRYSDYFIEQVIRENLFIVRSSNSKPYISYVDSVIDYYNSLNQGGAN